MEKSPDKKPSAAPIKNSLQGQLLIAMPGMPDKRFAGTVSLVCYHNAEGAMALVLNRLVGTLNVNQVLDGLKSDINLPEELLRVHLGGPVAPQRGFVLHGAELRHTDSHAVTPEVSISATSDALMELMWHEGVIPWRFTLGCASWTAGQLENEIREGIWLSGPAARDIVFQKELPTMWQHALQSIGISHPEMLVAESGRA
jgi:putative transcriptional regulator